MVVIINTHLINLHFSTKGRRDLDVVVVTILLILLSFGISLLCIDVSLMLY